jgi:hypothetical protein
VSRCTPGQSADPKGIGQERTAHMKKDRFPIGITLLIAVLAGCNNCSPSPNTAHTEIPHDTTKQPTKTRTIEKHDPVIVPVLCTLKERPYDRFISRNTPAILSWGWEAKTRGQIDAYLQNATTIVTLDEEVISEEFAYTLYENPEEEMPIKIIWEKNVGILSVGTHIMVYDVSFSNKITDGVQDYGPGTANPSLHDECRLSAY